MDLHFARKLEAIALSVEEIKYVAQSCPVAFAANAQGWRAMAIFGPGDGNNRFVVAPLWRWRGQYIPALMRAYPFMLEPKNQDAIRLWPGVVPEPLEDGVLPLVEDGQPTARVRQIFGFLHQVHNGMVNVKPTLDLLGDEGILIPWSRNGGPEIVLGEHKLFVVDADGFARLSDEVFLRIRELQALPWLYAHLHSLHHSRIFDVPEFTPVENVSIDPVSSADQELENANFEILSALSEDLGDFEI